MPQNVSSRSHLSCCCAGAGACHCVCAVQVPLIVPESLIFCAWLAVGAMYDRLARAPLGLRRAAPEAPDVVLLCRAVPWARLNGRGVGVVGDSACCCSDARGSASEDELDPRDCLKDNPPRLVRLLLALKELSLIHISEPTRPY